MIKNIFLVLVVLFLSACEQKEKIIPSGNIIKIGILAPLSEENKRLGQQSLLGIKAANKMKKYLNNGDEIVFEIVDTKYDIQTAKKAFKELLARDVKLVFSFMSSTQMLAMQEDFAKAKKSIIVTLAADSSLIKKDGYLSQICSDNTTQILVASHYVKDEEFIESVGIIYDSSSIYSLSVAEGFKDYYSSIDGKVEFFIDITSDKGMEEFTKTNKKNIALVFSTANSSLTTSILKILNKQKYSFKILGTDGLFSEALELSKKDLNLFEGVYVLDHYAHAKNRSENREILEALLEKDGIKGSSFAFLAFDGYQLLINALENCPNYNEQCINLLLQNSGIIEGVADNFSVHEARVKRAIYIDKIENSILKKEVVIY